MACFMSGHHVQKRLHIAPTKRLCRVAAWAARSDFNKGPTFVSGMKAPHARGHHTGRSSEPGYAGQPLIDRHRRRFGRKGDHCRRWIAFAQNIGFFFQSRISVRVIAPNSFFTCPPRIDVAAAK